MALKKKLHLSSRIDFGKYRESPMRLKDIIDTAEGRNWVRWMNENSWCFEFDHTVLSYLKLQEENGRFVLQPEGSK